MPADRWQTGQLRSDTSYLTGREVITNTDPDRFLVLPERCSRAAYGRAIESWTSRWRALNRSIQPSPHLRSLVSSGLDRADHADGLGSLLDGIFVEEHRWNAGRGATGFMPWWRTDKTRIRDLLMAFYREGLLVFPAGQSEIFTKTAFPMDEFGAAGLVGEQWIGATKSKLAHVVPAVARMLLSRAGALCVGDLVPEVVGDDIRSRPIGPALARGLWQAQRAEHGNALKHGADHFGPFGRVAPRGRDGVAFDWATERDPGLEVWRGLASEFLATRDNSKQAWRTGLNAFLDHLVAHPGLPREPALYLRRGAEPKPRFEHKAPQAHNYVASFLGWVLDTRFSEEGEDGAPVRVRGHANPLPRKGSKPEHSKTTREAMPTRLVRLALEILTENDCAWARNQETDVFHARNRRLPRSEPRCQAVGTVLVPCAGRRPLRPAPDAVPCVPGPHEDSGEADTMSYDARTRAMAPNAGPLRSGSAAGPVQKGIDPAPYLPSLMTRVRFGCGPSWTGWQTRWA